MAEALGTAVLELTTDDSGLRTGVASAKKQADDLGKRFKKVGDDISDVGKSLTTFTLPVAAIGGAALKASIDFESAFAGVRKTVDATEPELASLEAGIRQMATEIPASATAIAGVAEAAGQLGIQTENILGFTRVMVDLGNSTNLSADEAATALARLANITQMPQDEFDRLGATVVALGNNLATTEAEIVEMGLRIAGAGSQIGLTEAQILGFAGALSSVGIEAEAGGSAISRVMINIANEVAGAGENLELFAAVAGMTADEFGTAFRTDAAGALIEFIEGLGRMGAEGENVFGVLEELGLSEIRVRDALLRASGAGDLFRESIALGSRAWEENIALTREAEQRYATTESRLGVLMNRVTDVGITLGDALVPALMKALEAADPILQTIAGLANQFANLDPQMQTTIITVGALAAAIGPALLVLGTLTTAIGGLLNPIGLVVVAVTGLTAAWIAFGDDIKADVMRAINAIVQSFVGLKEDVVNLVTGLIDAVNEWFGESKLGKAVQSVQDAVGKVTGFFRGMFDAVVGHSFVPDMVTGVVSWFRTMHDGMVSRTEDATERVKTAMAEAEREATGSADSMSVSVLQAFERTKKGVQAFSRDAASSLVSFFDAVGEGEKTFADFGSAVKDFLTRMLSSLEVQVLAQQAAGIATAIAMAPATFGASLAAIPSILAETAATLVVFEGLKSVIRGLAEGGTLTSSGLVMVGEEGPEILNLPRGASVIPLGHPAMAGAGFGTANIIVELDGERLAEKLGVRLVDTIRLSTGIREF